MHNQRVNESIESPCVDVCQLRKGDDVCRGCYRTLDEIADWGQMTPSQRRHIMSELRMRKNTAEPLP